MNKLDLSNTDDRIFGRMLARQAEQAGDTEFLISDDQRISFCEAEKLTNALAGGLQGMGIASGDRVALYIGNRPEMVLLALAVNKLGAIWTPINTDYKGEWLLDTLNRGRCKLLVTDETLQSRIADIQQKLEIEQLVLIADSDSNQLAGEVSNYTDLVNSAPISADYNGMDYGDTCAILWTSGTTGKSKGVMQSYNNWIRAIVEGASKQYNSQSGDVIYCVLPLFNSGAWITSIFRSLIEGIPCVIESKFSVSGFWDRVKQFGATQTFAIGAMGVFLMNSPEREDDADTPLSTALIVPMPTQQWQPFEQRFGLKLLRGGLGMSECLQVLRQLDDREGVPVYALGFAPADVEVGLFDDSGQAVADGGSGEICIKPLVPHVLFNGYFDNPEATAASYRGDWFLTGDIGRKDPATGAYFFMDRKKDAVRFAGRNISTLEVESVVRQHPDVQDVAAFGIPSSELESEDELMISVVLKQWAKPSHEDVCAFINDNGPHYFVPRYMTFVDSLPYTPTNKVKKFVLRDAGVCDQTWDLKKSDYRVQR